MRKNPRLVRSAALVLTVLALSQGEARADGITYEDSSWVYSYTAFSPTFDAYASGADAQVSGSHEAVRGASIASSAWTLSPTQVDIAVDHLTEGYGNLCIGEANIRFQVDSTHSYALSGSYAFGAADPDDFVQGLGYYFAQLWDLTTDTYLCSAWQSSYPSSGDTFTLGGLDGNFQNGLAGSLTGTLQPGHEYVLFTDMYIQNEGFSNLPMFAQGNVRLDVTPVAEVDTDGDGLTDDEEAELGSDPLVADTDGDGLTDGAEVALADGTGCPDLLVADSDGDSLLDGDEVTLGTSPCDADTDDDGAPDGVDPSPLEPGAPTEELVEWAEEIAADLAAVPLSVVDAPNANSAAGRRASLEARMESVAKAIADGDLTSALDLIASIRSRLDGLPNPDDWLVDSSTKSDLLAELDALASLLD